MRTRAVRLLRPFVYNSLAVSRNRHDKGFTFADVATLGTIRALEMGGLSAHVLHRRNFVELVLDEQGFHLLPQLVEDVSKTLLREEAFQGLLLVTRVIENRTGGVGDALGWMERGLV